MTGMPHSLHAKRWYWADHLYASPPPTGKLQNDTFLKAQLSKVLGQITSLFGGHLSLGCSSEDAIKIIILKASLSNSSLFWHSAQAWNE